MKIKCDLIPPSESMGVFHDHKPFLTLPYIIFNTGQILFLLFYIILARKSNVVFFESFLNSSLIFSDWNTKRRMSNNHCKKKFSKNCKIDLANLHNKVHSFVTHLPLPRISIFKNIENFFLIVIKNLMILVIWNILN